MDLQNYNLDFSVAVKIGPPRQWLPSPAAGVERHPLEREQKESGRTTSIVKYAPGSSFPRHTHGSGEEYLVLEGTFSDDKGDYPAGTYVRNPPGSSHVPFSDDGCTIFVKLCQMNNEQNKTVVKRPEQWAWKDDPQSKSKVAELYNDKFEHVYMQSFQEAQVLNWENAAGGMEILVLTGEIEVGEEASNSEMYPSYSWLRVPSGEKIALKIAAGTTVWVKQGHLAGL